MTLITVYNNAKFLLMAGDSLMKNRYIPKEEIIYSKSKKVFKVGKNVVGVFGRKFEKFENFLIENEKNDLPIDRIKSVIENNKIWFLRDLYNTPLPTSIFICNAEKFVFFDGENDRFHDMIAENPKQNVFFSPCVDENENSLDAKFHELFGKIESEIGNGKIQSKAVAEKVIDSFYHEIYKNEKLNRKVIGSDIQVNIIDKETNDIEATDIEDRIKANELVDKLPDYFFDEKYKLQEEAKDRRYPWKI